MALINCKLCGHQVSENATACPSCGHPIKKIVKNSGCGVLLFCLAVCVLGAFIIMLFLPQTTLTALTAANTEERSSTVRINVAVSKNIIGNLIEITNKDTFDWTNIKLGINCNPKTFISEYTLQVAVIKSGETYTAVASEFAKSDGELFNPSNYKMLNLSIVCDTPQGMGVFFGNWK